MNLTKNIEDLSEENFKIRNKLNAMKKQLSKEESQVTKIYMNTFSISVIIKEMQIETF